MQTNVLGRQTQHSPVQPIQESNMDHQPPNSAHQQRSIKPTNFRKVQKKNQNHISLTQKPSGCPSKQIPRSIITFKINKFQKIPKFT